MDFSPRTAIIAQLFAVGVHPFRGRLSYQPQLRTMAEAIDQILTTTGWPGMNNPSPLTQVAAIIVFLINLWPAQTIAQHPSKPTSATVTWNNIPNNIPPKVFTIHLGVTWATVQAALAQLNTIQDQLINAALAKFPPPPLTCGGGNVPPHLAAMADLLTTQPQLLHLTANQQLQADMHWFTMLNEQMFKKKFPRDEVA